MDWKEIIGTNEEIHNTHIGNDNKGHIKPTARPKIPSGALNSTVSQASQDDPVKLNRSRLHMQTDSDIRCKIWLETPNGNANDRQRDKLSREVKGRAASWWTDGVSNADKMTDNPLCLQNFVSFLFCAG